MGLTVSVIMSVYNPKKPEYLEKSVNSIINQSFREWEMIICDDGSDSKHSDIIKKISESDKRIRLIKNKTNKGLGYSLNRCIKQATGEYVARMDADDVSLPDRFEKQLAFLKSKKAAAWCGTDVFLFNDGGVWSSRHMPERPKKKDFLHFSPFVHSSVMFKKKVLTENGGYKPLNRSEDYELFMRLLSKGYRGYNIPEKLHGYREDEDNYKRRTFKCALEEYAVRKKGFKELGMFSVKNYAYVVKPVVVSAIPPRMQILLKKLFGKK